ncbi:MAG TPA: hypothetical protein VMY99_02485 [Nevskiaceae bacterium]|nr:hypothetical protein [Nevskiaceae bacterium]
MGPLDVCDNVAHYLGAGNTSATMLTGLLSKSPATLREDRDDVLQVLDVMMAKIDEQFNKVEGGVAKTQKQVQHILNQLDGMRSGLRFLTMNV